MLGLLLLKDLRRARRNPLPYLIHLCMPLVITGLLGLVFSGGNTGGGAGLGRIKVVIVDEDDSLVTRFLRGALSQGDATKYLEPQFLDREAGLRLVTNNVVAAALIIPRGFAADYVAGRSLLTLELVKNPAQQFHPAVVEELLGALTSALNALARNFREDLADWRDVVAARDGLDYRRIAALIGKTGDKVEILRHRLDPVPVVYEKESRTGESLKDGGAGPGFNLFAFLLPGMAAMFLFFIAEAAMRDLHREVRLGTFARFCTLPPSVFTFVLAKVLFVFVAVALGAAILLGLGPVLFGFHWVRPLQVGVLALALGMFSSGLMAALVGFLGGDRKSDVLTTMVGMFLGFGAGCAFPAESLPPLLRDHLTPLLPPYWFIQAVHASQTGGSPATDWRLAAVRMAVLGLGLAVVAAWQLRRRLQRGGRT